MLDNMSIDVNAKNPIHVKIDVSDNVMILAGLALVFVALKSLKK